MKEMTELQRRMLQAFPDASLRLEEPLSQHTSFKIGGPCEVLAFPRSVAELAAMLCAAAAWGVQPAVLGAGTNILAADQGRRGLVICTKGCLEGMEQVGETRIRVQSGVTMARAAVFAAGLGLSGLEFAHGIPGTVGGGVYMNAGAYGGEIKQVAVRTEFLDLSGKPHALEGEAQDFSYRHSAFTQKPCVVTSVEFALTMKPETEIRAKMQELMARRRASQPLELPSAGSTFKRPIGGYAAALIEQAGLKGLTVGGAAVSTKHAGFVVNMGNATAEDVLSLIKQIQERVFDNSGIRLEPEVLLL